ncbi:MAG: glycosyltransferase [Scytolyngbya sp. HA4215-MV1]|nr:glycosyltransferase [Scytolyngbya sp. HA4215-MV1]
MKFSLVITTYNRLPQLQRAIASALSQTLPCEIIIADDGSSDGTEAYIHNLLEQLHQAGDYRLIYHRNLVNQGHSAAVNAGTQFATGEWIKTLDDDDYLEPDCIEKISQATSHYPQAVICSCQAAQVNVEGKELGRTCCFGAESVICVPQKEIHYGMLLEQLPFGTSSQVAFRKDAFVKAGGWDTQLTNCDEIDFWIRVAEFGDAVLINECLVNRTIWQGGHDYRIPLQKRLTTNIQMKQKIYDRVSPLYRSQLPQFTDIQAYMCLHWSFVAFKKSAPFTALKFLFPAFFYVNAWKLLLNSMKQRQSQNHASGV